MVRQAASPAKIFGVRIRLKFKQQLLGLAAHTCQVDRCVVLGLEVHGLDDGLTQRRVIAGIGPDNPAQVHRMLLPQA